jgi:hypothetical protein
MFHRRLITVARDHWSWSKPYRWSAFPPSDSDWHFFDFNVLFPASPFRYFVTISLWTTEMLWLASECNCQTGSLIWLSWQKIVAQASNWCRKLDGPSNSLSVFGVDVSMKQGRHHIITLFLSFGLSRHRRTDLEQEEPTVICRKVKELRKFGCVTNREEAMESWNREQMKC